MKTIVVRKSVALNRRTGSIPVPGTTDKRKNMLTFIAVLALLIVISILADWRLKLLKCDILDEVKSMMDSVPQRVRK